MSTQATGQSAEQNALNYLVKQGLKLVMSNYNCRVGELDLIMRDGAYLVIVEVRYRSPSSYGSGVDSITYSKKQKIIKATSHYLMRYKIQDKFPIRFDVLSIDGKSGAITWIKDAFGLDY